MIQSTFPQRFEKLKNRRKNASKFFSEELAPWLKLPLKDTTPDIWLQYHFMKYVGTNLMISKSLEEFIARCIMEKKEAEEKLNFPEEFDWVNHCVLSAQIHAGKGPDSITMYCYIHASFDLIKYYELKNEIENK